MATKSERPGKILRDELMSKHTTWRVGGPADVYHAPRCRAELLEFFRGLDASTPVYWVGFGSNLLVRDGGIRGVVIATSQALGELRNLGGGVIEALADEMMPTLIKAAKEHVMPGTMSGIEIKASKLGDNAGITGAAVLARRGTA